MGAGSKSMVLAAATPQSYVIDVDDRATKLAILIKNVGANAVTTTLFERSPTGTLYATDSTTGSALGTPGAGATGFAEIAVTACRKVRLTLTSTSGTTVSVEWSTVE